MAEKRAAEREANAQRKKEQEEKNADKTKMKGKNRPSKRYRKKQLNIIEEKKPLIKGSVAEGLKVRIFTLLPNSVLCLCGA